MGIPGGKRKLVKKSVIISNGSQLKKGVNFVVVVFFFRKFLGNIIKTVQIMNQLRSQVIEYLFQTFIFKQFLDIFYLAILLNLFG